MNKVHDGVCLASSQMSLPLSSLEQNRHFPRNDGTLRQ